MLNPAVTFPATNLSYHLLRLRPFSETPWKLSALVLEKIMQQPPKSVPNFTGWAILPADPEYHFILNHLLLGQPSGPLIEKITVLHNVEVERTFESSLESSMKISFLWCGTSEERCLSICSSTSTCFNTGNLDDLHFTPDLNVAIKQSQGALLLSWIPTQIFDSLNDRVCIFPQFYLEIAKDKPYKDIEGYYYKLLIQAKEAGLIKEQVLYLEMLSNHYVHKLDLVKGALLLNSALAIAQAHLNPEFVEPLLCQLEAIENRFLAGKGIETPNRANSVAVFRKILQDNRKKTENTFEKLLECNRRFKELPPTLRAQVNPIISAIMGSSDPAFIIQSILKEMTSRFKQLLSDLVSDAQDLLGPPPVSWVCIGLGSMARDEMSPYSDVEFAFIIQEATPECLTYFRTLAQLLQLKIINLGETAFPVFGDKYPSPTPSGFCMDTGGNTPLGKPGLYELIGTPAQLAEYLKPQAWREDVILANVLSNVCYVSGDITLLHAYHAKKDAVMKNVEENNPWKNCTQLAVYLLKGNIREFKPDVSIAKEQIKAFGIKQELYRPFQSTLSALALLYELKSTNAFEIINELESMQFFNPEGTQSLKQALSLVFSLRLEAHFFYQTEQEYLVHGEEGLPRDPTLLYIEERHIDLLHTIYQTLLPFHKTAENFLATKRKSLWNKEMFKDESSFTRGKTFCKAFLYQQAREAYQEAVSLDPNNADALNELSCVECNLGNYQMSIEHQQKALQLAVSQKKIPAEQAMAHSNLGSILLEVGRYAEASQHFAEALLLDKQVYGEDSSKVALRMAHLAISDTQLGNLKRAKSLAESALVIFQKNNNHQGIETAASCLGQIRDIVEDYPEALAYYRISLQASKAAYGDPNPRMSVIYSSIGTILGSMKKFKKAYRYLNKSLYICEKFQKKHHPDFCAAKNNLGAVLVKEGKIDEGIQCLEEGLAILEKIEPSPVVLVQLMSHVALLRGVNKGEIELGLRMSDKALTLLKKNQLENHFVSALLLNTQGEILCAAGETQRSIPIFQLALNVALQHYSADDSRVRVISSNLALAQSTKQPTEEKSLSERATMIMFAKKGREALGNKDFGAALSCFQQTLKLTVAVYGPDHPEVKYSQEMANGLMPLMEDQNPIGIMMVLLSITTLLSNFEDLKPIIGSVNEFTKGVL